MGGGRVKLSLFGRRHGGDVSVGRDWVFRLAQTRKLLEHTVHFDEFTTQIEVCGYGRSGRPGRPKTICSDRKHRYFLHCTNRRASLTRGGA